MQENRESFGTPCQETKEQPAKEGDLVSGRSGRGEAEGPQTTREKKRITGFLDKLNRKRGTSTNTAQKKEEKKHSYLKKNRKHQDSGYKSLLEAHVIWSISFDWDEVSPKNNKAREEDVGKEKRGRKARWNSLYIRMCVCMYVCVCVCVRASCYTDKEVW